MTIVSLALFISSIIVNDSFGQNQTNAAGYKISVNLARTSHVMAGGIGASWHSMGATVFYYPDLIKRDNRTCKGSGFGGNPPVTPEYTKAWYDLLEHAKWLGLDFIRVEVAVACGNLNAKNLPGKTMK